MDQDNNRLKQTLINRYSKLTRTSQSVLKENLKNVNWRNKEQRRLNVQNTISILGSCLVFLGCCLVVVFSAADGLRPSGNLSVPFISFAGLVFALIMTQKVESKIKEKIRLFELLQISIDSEL